MICEVDSEWLHARGEAIAAMLVPLTGPRRVAHDRISERSQIVISVYSGQRPVLQYRDWRFTTISRSIRGGYFELWRSSDEKRKRFYLDRAYLHLYWQPRPQDDEKELLALHCDPNEPEDSGLLRHAVYKRGPHVHVMAAEQPLPHSHFALNAGQLEEVLGSAERLSRAVGSGVTLIRDQILDVFDEHRPSL